MTWPLAFLPYLPAYLVWCAIGMALYLWAASDGGRRPERLFMLVVAPAVWINIFAGQNGFLTAALMIAGLAAARPPPGPVRHLLRPPHHQAATRPAACR